MKKFFSTMLMLLMVSVSMVSCSNDDDEPTNSSKSIVGTWEQINDYGTKIDITFRSNLTGDIKYYHTNGNTSTEVFEYSYDDDEKELYILGDRCQLSGYYDVVITATKLTLTGYLNDGEYGVFMFERK